MSETGSATKPMSEGEARAHLAAIVDSSDDAIVSKTPDGIVTSWNRGAETLYGYSAQEAVGRHISLIIPAERIEELRRITERILRGERVERLETERVAKDGRRIWVVLTLSPIVGAAGRIAGISTIARDVTERLRMERSLRESEERLKLALDAAEMGSCDIDMETGKGIWSPRHFRLMGYQPPESGSGAADNEMWQGRIHPDDKEQVIRAVDQARRERGLFRSEHRIARADDGRTVWVNVQGRFLCDPTGAACRFIGVVHDVTERKASEEALKKSEATLKLAVEVTGLGVFDLDLRTGKGDWSDIAKRHYGLPPEAEGDLALLMSGVHPEDRERLERIARDALDPRGAGAYSAEYRTVGIADGRLRWLTMGARVSRDEEGAPARLVGACLDITDIVLAEKKLKDEITERLRAVEELGRQEQLLIRQGRLAAMGEMIGNIAHQWRQPLNTLGLIVQEMPLYYRRGLFTREYLDAGVTRAMQVINYMSKTIDGFRNFYGPDRENELFNAGRVLSKTVSIVEAAFKELNLMIEVSADSEIAIHGCPNEFSQVILNILVNAKDAIIEREVEHPLVRVRLFREKDRAVLTVTDNAGGIDPEIMDKIFDPYFTTKGPDTGTGIGLFMSKTIIEKNMNGALTVRNTETGAEFRIEV